MKEGWNKADEGCGKDEGRAKEGQMKNEGSQSEG